MATLDLFNQNKKKVGTVELNDDVFDVKVNIGLVHQVIKAQLAGRRQGTAKTKTKSEVRGGGRKPFKQKGTGNARQGSIRSPLQPGGGQNFGPIPRSYAERTPKEMMRGALRSALSDRLKSKRLFVVDQFVFDEVKTKAAALMLKAWGFEKPLLLDANNINLELSGRNLKGVRVLRPEGLNVYDVVKSDAVLLSRAALEEVTERLA
jgi:large subunit ribosomal protein L4